MLTTCACIACTALACILQQATMIFGRDREFPDKQTEVVCDDGDVTVNRGSLEDCSAWNQQQDYGVPKYFMYPFQIL